MVKYIILTFYLYCYFFICCTFKCSAENVLPDFVIKFHKDDVDSIKLAIFEKGSFTWVVFDRKADDNLASVVSNYRDIVRLVMNQKYTILRFKSEGKLPKIYKSNNLLSISFNVQNEKLSYAVTPEKKGSNVYIPIQSYNDIINIVDPDDQNNLLIIPLPYPGQKIDHYYKFVSFNLLKTQNGIVVESKVDDLKINKITNGVSIGNVEIDIDSINDSEENVVFPFSRWFYGDSNQYYDIYKKIIGEIYSASSTTDKLLFRLKLIKFYSAHGLFAESLGYLRYVKKIHDDIVDYEEILREYKLLAMVSLYMNGMYQKALEMLNSVNQNGFNDKQLEELKFWYDAINIKLQKKDANISYLDNVSTFLPYYIKTKEFAFLALESSIENREVEVAKQISKLLEQQNLLPKEESYLKLLKADILLLESKSNIDQVIGEYDQVARSSIDDPQNKSWAIYKKVLALYESDKIKLSEAINMLEKLTMIWRGDKFEAKLTYFLSDLYMKNKEYGKGLSILRNMLIYYPKYANVLEVSKKMNDIFIYLFHQHGASEMPNFEATTLFYDFRELMPIGEIGIEMTLNLIDRLVDLDLIGGATFFLNHLVKYRIKDDYRKGKYSLNLANIYYDNNQLTESLQVLSEYQEVINKNFAQDFKYIKTQVLMKLKRYSDAINTIKNDSSEIANKLRSDIFWHAKMWKELQELAESKLVYREQPPKKLSELEQEYVFRLVVSYAYTLNNGGIIGLYKAFKDMISNEEHKEIIKELVKISHLSSPRSLDNYLNHIYILYKNINKPIVRAN